MLADAVTLTVDHTPAWSRDTSAFSRTFEFAIPPTAASAGAVVTVTVSAAPAETGAELDPLPERAATRPASLGPAPLPVPGPTPRASPLPTPPAAPAATSEMARVPPGQRSDRAVSPNCSAPFHRPGSTQKTASCVGAWEGGTIRSIASIRSCCPPSNILASDQDERSARSIPERQPVDLGLGLRLRLG